MGRHRIPSSQASRFWNGWNCREKQRNREGNNGANTPREQDLRARPCSVPPAPASVAEAPSWSFAAPSRFSQEQKQLWVRVCSWGWSGGRGGSRSSQSREGNFALTRPTILEMASWRKGSRRRNTSKDSPSSLLWPHLMQSSGVRMKARNQQLFWVGQFSRTVYN